MVLIKDGMPTSKLQKVLYQIFSMYANHRPGTSVGVDVDMDLANVSEIMASRLWYRCGMKLSTLDDILISREKRNISFRDFLSLIQQVIDDEQGENMSVEGKKSLHTMYTFNFEVCLHVITKIDSILISLSHSTLMKFISSLCIPFQIGDKVELVDGFERYGDASSGPLQVGDRGIVVEVQQGLNGEKYGL